MCVQSRQTVRIIKFITEMKKNYYPNASSFAKLLRKADIDENFACACRVQTIMRDIENLQRDYHAPIEYDLANRDNEILSLKDCIGKLEKRLKYSICLTGIAVIIVITCLIFKP